MLTQVRQAAESGSTLWEEHWRRFDAIRYDGAALRWDGILDLVDRRLASGRMLEAGCGLGRYLLYVHGRGGDSIGVDFASETLSRLRRHQPAARVVAGDLTQLPFDQHSFDTILCLGVLEHFADDPRPPLAQLAAALRPSGWLIVTVPYANLLKRRRAARGGGDIMEAGQPLPAGTRFYQYCFTRSEARGLIERAGLNVITDRRISRLFWLLGGRSRTGGASQAAVGVQRQTGARTSESAARLIRPVVREAAYWAQWAIPGDWTSHMIAVVGQKPA